MPIPTVDSNSSGQVASKKTEEGLELGAVDKLLVGIFVFRWVKGKGKLILQPSREHINTSNQ